MNDFTQQRRDADAKLDGLPTFADRLDQRLAEAREQRERQAAVTPRFINKMQEQNREFHTAFGIPTPDEIAPLPAEQVPVAVELIREEFEDELIPALYSGDLVEQVDALVDLLYVTFGVLNRIAVDGQAVYDEVHRSNMSKLGSDGKPIIAGENDPDGVFPGRVKKGPGYFKPDIAGVLQALAIEQDVDSWDGRCGDPECSCVR